MKTLVFGFCLYSVAGAGAKRNLSYFWWPSIGKFGWGCNIENGTRSNLKKIIRNLRPPCIGWKHFLRQTNNGCQDISLNVIRVKLLFIPLTRKYFNSIWFAVCSTSISKRDLGPLVVAMVLLKSFLVSIIANTQYYLILMNIY